MENSGNPISLEDMENRVDPVEGNPGVPVQRLDRPVNRKLCSKGLFVVFLGSDGSGKTAVIERIQSDLAPVFGGGTAYRHLRPGIFRKNSHVAPVMDPYAKAPRSVGASVAKIIFWWCDYFFGWWLMIRPKLADSTLVVFDRYYHDMLIDPRRYRYGGPMWMARWVGKLIPKPDMWILLDAPAEVLQARREKAPCEDVDRQRIEYLNWVRSMKNGIVIDASQTLDEVVARVNQAILDTMTDSTEKNRG